MTTTITSQTSYGMHKAKLCISGQLITSRGKTVSHSHTTQSDKIQSSILVKEKLDGGFIFLKKLCENTSPMLALFILVAKWNYGWLFLNLFFFAIITSSFFFPFWIKQTLNSTFLNHSSSVTRSIQTHLKNFLDSGCYLSSICRASVLPSFHCCTDSLDKQMYYCI